MWVRQNQAGRLPGCRFLSDEWPYEARRIVHKRYLGRGVKAEDRGLGGGRGWRRGAPSLPLSPIGLKCWMRVVYVRLRAIKVNTGILKPEPGCSHTHGHTRRTPSLPTQTQTVLCFFVCFLNHFQPRVTFHAAKGRMFGRFMTLC